MKNHKKGGATMWIILLIIVVAAIAIYFYYSSQNSSSGVPVTTTGTSTSTLGMTDTTTVSASGTASWQAFNDDASGVSFKYPVSWGAPVKSTSGAPYSFVFKNTLKVEAGQFFDSTGTKVLTIPQMVANLSSATYGVGPANRDIVSTSINVGGKTATEVTYTQTSDSMKQTKIFIPHKSATNFIVVTDKNDLISPAVLSAFVGTVVGR